MLAGCIAKEKSSYVLLVETLAKTRHMSMRLIQGELFSLRLITELLYVPGTVPVATATVLYSISMRMYSTGTV